MKLDLPELVVVTGSAAGLGESLVELLLDDGVAVVGVDLSQAGSVVASRSGYRHVQGGVDKQPTWDAVRALVDETAPTSVGLVACAAMLVQGTVEEVSTESWRRLLDVNVIGVAHSLRSLVPVMERCGGGAAVIVGSVSGFLGEESNFAYGASKAAAMQMTRAGALDLGRRNVRVNTVSPGPMNTAMFRAHAAEAPDPVAFLQRRKDRQPLGFVLEPRQVANGVAFLLSQQSNGITGVNLPVDAGLTAGFEFRNLSMSGGGKHHGAVVQAHS
ncbi:MAG: SDR family NAD(P)-dependent oxidoreductase [Rhodococcus sp. (in: high G+C Gram-positive bacteria)]